MRPGGGWGGVVGLWYFCLADPFPQSGDNPHSTPASPLGAWVRGEHNSPCLEPVLPFGFYPVP